jgi:D-methionine transport system permease protein
MSLTTLSLLLNATAETVYMVFVSGVVAAIIGIPIGIILYATRKNHILANPFTHQFLAALVNMTRSIPFVILMIAVIPFTRALVGSSIGTNAAIVPLSLCAIPFIARIVENALLEVSYGLIEAGTAMGADIFQIITKILIPESLPGIINGLTLTFVTLIGYSAMAGAVGGGGLGDLAIRYGYQRFDVGMMVSTILIMIVMVQFVQFIGDKLAKQFTYHK